MPRPRAFRRWHHRALPEVGARWRPLPQVQRRAARAATAKTPTDEPRSPPLGRAATTRAPRAPGDAPRPASLGGLDHGQPGTETDTGRGRRSAMENGRPMSLHPIAVRRCAAGLTQAALAHAAGVSLRALSRIEFRSSHPRPPTVRALALALKVDPRTLLDEIRADAATPGGTRDPRPPRTGGLRRMDPFAAIPPAKR